MIEARVNIELQPVGGGVDEIDISYTAFAGTAEEALAEATVTANSMVLAAVAAERVAVAGQRARRRDSGR